MRSPHIIAGMTVGLAAAVALAEKSESPHELRAARMREHAEQIKERDRRHSPEGNRRQRRAAAAIYRSKRS